MPTESRPTPRKRTPAVAAERNQAVGDENKDTSAAQPLDAAATAPESALDRPVDPDKAASESTPVHDNIPNRLLQDLESASDEERTTFEEDDDPLSNVGDVLDDDDPDNPDKENSR